MTSARPNLFVIGAEKAGTTTLCTLLAEHPDVFLSNPREPNFFTRPRDEDEWRRYESLFAGAHGFKIVGEGSTTYSKCDTHPGTPARVAEYVPGAKIIYIVRHPLDRMRSQWLQRIDMSMPTPDDFSQAVRTLPVFLDASRYWRNISAWREHFDDLQILVLFLEDLQTDAVGTLNRCFQFLDLADFHRFTDPHRPRNTAAEKRSDRRLLRLLRRVPGYTPLRDRLAPQHLRRLFKPLLTRPIVARPEFDPQTQAWAADQLAADALQFLTFYGKPADYWNLNAARAA